MIDRIQRALPAAQPHSIEPAKAQQAFSQFLKEAINEVNRQQIESDQLTTKLVKGENIDLHTVMIASQKASISLQLALEVRNKVIEAYQEVMRMQV
ncbi:flagellar hook-basal body protein FliE [Anoxybacillus gonensis]|uniref:Flagellar hook-basal body complex protein FliE n=1 Tax=Anoxybacillus gonensis TaxID=198467 RepID=A0AAW7TGR0_9BACL|nr:MULTISPECIES: flagellar hook-basal body complex protein FliE [Anoxybacillus]AXM87890.1 flagellar hook-basal body complex protein FliE [Anoxybacillus ayderensis G10]THD16355.1 flagellar hook-basal body complex protein FliE [Anoxybacillus ayderensis]AKS38043.1 flagellar hook-basal body protein FliE [Anoxybacillus gonensis]KGP60894.1 flagellar hook-basal body protein FliE [Anoxybacillus gonensis]MBW9217028.1 flagellar hook-basal body complex protein FliE [Anoxybacillus sp. ST70]